MKNNNLQLNKRNNTTKVKQRRLPDSYYQKILEFEIQLENQFDVVKLSNLLVLYLIGVEYFDLNNLYFKMKGFVKRIDKFLLQSLILANIKDTFNINPPFLFQRLVDIALEIVNKKEANNILNQISVEQLVKDEAELTKLIQQSFSSQTINYHFKLSSKRKTTNQFDSIKKSNLNSLHLHSTSNPILLNDTKAIESPSVLFPEFHSISTTSPLNNSNIVVNNSSPKNSEFSFITNKCSNCLTTDTKQNFKLCLQTSFNKKQLSIIHHMKAIIDTYVTTLNNHIFYKYFIPSVNKLKVLYKTKYLKYINICKGYNTQIKDTQFYLFQENKSSQRQDEIDLFIGSLVEEKNHELEKIEEDCNTKINNELIIFKTMRLKDKNDIIVFKEKIMIDLYNLMLILLSPMTITSEIKLFG